MKNTKLIKKFNSEQEILELINKKACTTISEFYTIKNGEIINNLTNIKSSLYLLIKNNNEECKLCKYFSICSNILSEIDKKYLINIECEIIKNI